MHMMIDPTGTAAGLSGRHEFLPTRAVIWGAGSIAKLPEELDRMQCRRVFLCTTASLAKSGLVENLTSLLEGRLTGCLSNLPAHVPVEALDQASQVIDAAQPDVFVAFGGGSVIDATKALAARFARTHGIQPRIIALPTTLSGAEFAHVYGVLEQGQWGPRKQSYFDPLVVPSVVFLDPELTLQTPRALWFSSAIKALDHAIEGILAPGERFLSDAVATAGIQHMSAALDRDDADDSATRLALQLAAWLCYFSPATARTGLSHRIGYVLGGTFGVQHSLTSCITLAPVMRRYCLIEPEKMRRLAVALGARNADPNEAPEMLAERVRLLGLPSRLRDIGLRQADIEVIETRVRRDFPEDSARIDVLGPNAFTELMGELL